MTEEDLLARTREALELTRLSLAAFEASSQAFAGYVTAAAAEVDDDAALGRRVRDLVIEHYGRDNPFRRQPES